MSKPSFLFKIRDSRVTAEFNNLDLFSSKKKDLYCKGFTKTQVDELLSLGNENEIKTWFSNLTTTRFFAFFHDKETGFFYIFNDKFGYNEIYITKKGKEIIVSSTVEDYSDKTINTQAVHEFLFFHTVIPPKTLLNEVETVPLAQCAKISIKNLTKEFLYYWDVESLFSNKYRHYKKLVIDLRSKFYKSITEDYEKLAAVSLSGGIDSGGILGILRDYTDDEILSISFGPYGKESGDLVSSRATANRNRSKNIELYPSNELFSYLFEFNKKLSLPLSADYMLSVAKILDEAKSAKVEKIYFGYGTQMLLGNLAPNKLWHKTRLIERVLPQFLTKIVYVLAIRVGGLSDNAKAILGTRDWRYRFFYMQGALFTREKHIYKSIPRNFMEETVKFLDPVYNSNLRLSDKFVLFYLNGWTNYLQGRFISSLCSINGLEPVLPFNKPEIANVICKTPDSFRKKNKWDKQVWRDAMKPYVSDGLRVRKGKSLTIKYDEVLLPHRDKIISYLEKNELLKQIINFDEYKKSITKLPEPGLNLLRMINLAIWYDTKFNNSKNISDIKAIVSRIEVL